MAVENKNRGAVKASEISLDKPITGLGVATQEDFLNTVQRLKNMAVDPQRQHSSLLTSSGPVTWVYPELRIPVGTTITIKSTMTTTDSQSRDINLTITGVANAVFPSTSARTPNANYTIIDFTTTINKTLYIEMNRTVLDSSPTGDISVSLNQAGPLPRLQFREMGPVSSGARTPVRMIAATEPALQPSLTIAVASTTSGFGDLMWTEGGLLWPNGTNTVLGQVSSEISVPVGTIIPWHRADGLTDTGVTQALVNNLCGEEWQLCNGSLITDVASPMNGSYTPNLNNDITSSFNQGYTLRSLVYNPTDYSDTFFSLDVNTDMVIYRGTGDAGASNITSADANTLANPAAWPQLSIGGIVNGPNLQPNTRVLDYFVADEQTDAGDYNSSGTYRMAVIIRLSKPALAPLNTSMNIYRFGEPTYLLGSINSPVHQYSYSNTVQLPTNNIHTHFFKTGMEFQPNDYRVIYYDGNEDLRTDDGNEWSWYAKAGANDQTSSDAWVGHQGNSYFSGYGLPHQNRPNSFDVIYLMRIK